jgi:TIR domain
VLFGVFGGSMAVPTRNVVTVDAASLSSSYDAFVSYSHAADGRLAPALQAGLQSLAKPWYRRRALRVFRDKTSLSASPELWPTIERALAQARYFVLLASPEAARSPWVDREVRWWRANRGKDTVLIVLTDGQFGLGRIDR